MIFLEGKSQYLNWSKYNITKLHPHQTEYIVALDNRVYVRSCTWGDKFSKGKWSVIQLLIDGSGKIEANPENYLNRPEGSSIVWSAIYNYVGNNDYPSSEELEDIFNREFELYIQSLIRNAKLKSIL